MAEQLKFVDSHNVAGYLMDPPPAHQEFKSMMRIYEQVIREVLEFGDASAFPIEYSADQVKEVLEMMCYEGTYPPTIKKLLPPYWRFLTHSFVICISRRKGGFDEISQTVTSAIFALVMNWDYNFSKFVFEEMKSNLQGKKKDLFLMYSMFLQMIFNEKYPLIERSFDTLAMKALGPNTFGLMKQSRKVFKVDYQRLKELVKFGKFSEVERSSAVSLINAEIVEKYMMPKPKFQFAYEEIEVSDDEEEEDQEKELTKNEFEDLIQQSISNIEEDAVVTPFDVPERDRDTTVQSSVPTPEQVDAFITKLQRTARKPPQIVLVTTEPPSESDQEDLAHNLLLRKRKRRDPSLIIEEVFPSEGAQASGSSLEAPELDISKGKSKLPESKFVDVALLQNIVFDLEQSSIEKDLITGRQDIRISELEKENSIKDAKISELQVNLGGENISASCSGAADPTSQSSSERAVRPAPDANIDSFLSSVPITAQERREKQTRVEQLKGKMIVMKHSNQNAPSDHPEKFFRESGEKFTDKYGDRSDIVMWGYDAEKKMWIVKRKSGQIEYYEKKVEFLPWTNVDLSELIDAPFYNPTNDIMTWSFKSFLEVKAKK
ncbi:unnamed protein product [Lactuca saligna]|uniref:Uncharacterized protein n=1 Tax=Lactuca saligna TaxID=75948 RepID=A0AA35Z4G4_LACSI|nr:unnamed protein product [Lactuca saligna]